MIAIVQCLVGTFCSILSTHRALALENLALRHQLLCKKPGEHEPHRQAGPGSCPVCGMPLEKKK